ncbi:MAG: DUF2802 domain-containing protein [Betaproteobacteria bacterium]|nr:DUF2802 domain-containing protein [Betaproteobacteria bacterium]
MMRKIVTQLDHERARITVLENHQAEERSGADSGMADPTRAGAGASLRPRPDTSRPDAQAVVSSPPSRVEAYPSPDSVAQPGARQTPRQTEIKPPTDTMQAAASGSLAGVAPTQAELRKQMLGLMQQLVAQGMTVRGIAARCGLSEAEAELMLRLVDSKA